MLRLKLLALPAFALVATACTELESEDVLTTGVSPNFTVEAAGTDGKSTATARLHAGKDSLTFLQLTGDDNLTASVGEDTKDLEKVSRVDFNAPAYSATFDTDAAETEFTFAFVRTIDDGAPASKVKLPSPYTVSEPTEAAEFSRDNDDIVVTISEAADDPTSVTLSGECIQSHDVSIAAGETTVTIAKGTLLPPDDEEDQETNTCTAYLSFTRSRSGTLDAAFTEGGSITASQIRSVSITLKP